MKPYLIVFKNTWDEMTTYRLNFVMWRVRNVLQLITLFVLWMALSQGNRTIFGYSQSLILTYILGTSFIGSLVLSSRTQEIGENINSGDLSMFLIRPWGYFKYWLFRDLGDKAMNTFFSIFEVILVSIIFLPPIFIQTNPLTLFLFVVALTIALSLNFLFGIILGLFGFWSADIWGPRFLFYILVSFFAGGIFPLDILPKNIFNIFQLLPFSYFLYFPIKIYLGQLSSSQIIQGISISLFWMSIFFIAIQYIWKQGLKKYDAVGR